jgi:photosystem II stability/assembly factor-like uncharacterized protein
MVFGYFLVRLFVTFSLVFLCSFHPVWAVSGEPLLVNEIAINPKDPRTLYAAARPQGVLKSTDRGMTWRPVRNGLTNTSGYHLVMHPTNPKILYLGTFGGGVYKSEDGGEHWFEVNQGLGNTNIHALILNPLEPDQLVASTSTGKLFKSENGGKSWVSFNEGLPLFEGEVISTLLLFPKEPGGFYLAQGGLFKRPFPSQRWMAADSSLSEQVITALAYDARHRIMYAGTMRQGLFKTSLHSDPIASESRLDWTPVGAPFQKQWIRLITLDPSDPSVIYVVAIGGGLYKSTDQGASWHEINTGLPTKAVTGLAIDPTNPQLLYVGLQYSDGLFISRDGGTTWSLPALQIEPVQQIIASLSSRPPSAPSGGPPVVPPPAFAKCNQCHGWTDASLNQRATFWRVSPNRRDWRPTVQRMAPGARLTPQEEEEIIKFLTDYSRQRNKTP